MSIICNVKQIHIPYWGINDTDLAAAFFMLVGNKWHQTAFVVSAKWVMMGFGIMLLGTFLWSQQMIRMDWKTMIPYLLTGVVGSVLTLQMAKAVVNNGWLAMKKSFVFIGNNTLTILIWHFLCFKFISLVVIFCYNLPIESLAAFPVLIENSVKGWWIAYVMVGLTVPLVMSKSIMYFKKVLG